MSAEQQKWETRAANALFDLLAENIGTVVDWRAIACKLHAEGLSGPFSDSAARSAVFALRSILGDDAVVYVRRLRGYRLAVSADEGRAWLARNLLKLKRSTGNHAHYAEALALKFPDPATRLIWDFALQQMHRAEEDLDRLARLVADTGDGGPF